MPKKKTVLPIYLISLATLFLWLIGIFLAPYLRSRALPIQAFAYVLYSPICHQAPSRCFSLFGHPLAVCARCLGIYSGCLLGFALYPWLRGFRSVVLPATSIFILLSLPILVDTFGNFSQLWDTHNLGRFLTGIVWGTILPFYFITGIADLIHSPGQTPEDRDKNFA